MDANTTTEVKPNQQTQTEKQEWNEINVNELVDPILKGLNLDIPEPKKPAEKKAEEKPVEVKEEKKEEKPEEKKPAAEEKKEAPAPAQETPVAKKEEPQKPAVTQQPEDIAATSKLIAKETAKAVREVLKPATEQPKAKEEKPADDLNPVEKNYAEVFSQMEKANPSNTGLVQQFHTYRRQLKDYQTKWSDENPGKRFDIRDSEHSDFVERHWPSYNEDEFRTISTEMVAKRAVQQALENRDRKEREEVARKSVDDHAERIGQLLVSETAKAISPELEKAGSDLSKIEEVDPLAATIMESEVQASKSIIGEAIKLSEPDLRYKFNPENPLHLKIQNLVASMEAEVKAAGGQYLIRNGKMFATHAEFNRMSEEDRQNAWVIDRGDVISKIMLDTKDSVSKKISKIRKVMPAEQKQPAAKQETPPPVKKEEQPAESKKDKASPSTASSTDSAPSSVSEFQKNSGISDLIVSGMW